MHNDYHTYTTTSSSVTASRNDFTETFSISGKPTITSIRFEGGTCPDLNASIKIPVGITQKVFISGYNLSKHTTTVYLSASTGVYTTYLSGVSEFDLFTSYNHLSSNLPAFSGHQIYQVTSPDNPYDDLPHGFTAISPNTIQINISAAKAEGYMDVIISNPAGYTMLSNDLSGRIIALSG